MIEYCKAKTIKDYFLIEDLLVEFQKTSKVSGIDFTSKKFLVWFALNFNNLHVWILLDNKVPVGYTIYEVCEAYLDQHIFMYHAYIRPGYDFGLLAKIVKEHAKQTGIKEIRLMTSRLDRVNAIAKKYGMKENAVLMIAEV